MLLAVVAVATDGLIEGIIDGCKLGLLLVEGLELPVGLREGALDTDGLLEVEGLREGAILTVPVGIEGRAETVVATGAAVAVKVWMI